MSAKAIPLYSDNDLEGLKTVNLTAETQTITPTKGVAMKAVEVQGVNSVLQNVNVEVTKEAQTITAQAPYLGIKQVTVEKLPEKNDEMYTFEIQDKVLKKIQLTLEAVYYNNGSSNKHAIIDLAKYGADAIEEIDCGSIGDFEYGWNDPNMVVTLDFSRLTNLKKITRCDGTLIGYFGTLFIPKTVTEIDFTGFSTMDGGGFIGKGIFFEPGSQLTSIKGYSEHHNYPHFNFDTFEFPKCNITTLELDNLSSDGEGYKTLILPNNLKIITTSVEYKNQRLEKIVYRGTMEQWDAIDKRFSVNPNMENPPEYVIECVDGTLDKEGNPI